MSSKFIQLIAPKFNNIKDIKSKIGLAISGGPDSMCLLWAAQQLLPKEKLLCLLVNHNIHKESKQQIDKTVDYIESNGLSYKVLDINPVKSTEDNFRNLRYAIIEKQMMNNNIHDLLTGHNKDDDIETFLLRLFSSSGLNGLQGIAECARTPIYKQGFVHRPLLDIHKSELLQLCKDNNIPYSIDPTNVDVTFKRNKIRSITNRIDNNELVFPNSDLLKTENLEKTLLFHKRIGRLNYLRTDAILKEYFLPDQVFGSGLLYLAPDTPWMRDQYLACEVLRRIVMFVNPNKESPRQGNLLNLYRELLSGTKSFTGCGIWVREPQLSSGKNNYIISPMNIGSNQRKVVELQLNDIKKMQKIVVRYFVNATTSIYSRKQEFLFNDRHIYTAFFFKKPTKPMFVCPNSEIATDYTNKHLEVLKLSRFNLKIVCGNDQILGQMMAVLAALGRARIDEDGTKIKCSFATQAYRLKDQLKHFAAHSVGNRGIAHYIVHLDKDRVEYPVALPLLNINLIKHACQFHGKFLGDLNYIHKPDTKINE